MAVPDCRQNCYCRPCPWALAGSGQPQAAQQLHCRRSYRRQSRSGATIRLGCGEKAARGGKKDERQKQCEKEKAPHALAYGAFLNCSGGMRPGPTSQKKNPGHFRDRGFFELCWWVFFFLFLVVLAEFYSHAA